MNRDEQVKLLRFFEDALPLYEAAAAGEMNRQQIISHYMEYGICFHLRYWMSQGKMQTGYLVMNNLLDQYLKDVYNWEPQQGGYLMFPAYKLNLNVATSIKPRLEIIRSAINSMPKQYAEKM